jgi:hypothetical protein
MPVQRRKARVKVGRIGVAQFPRDLDQLGVAAPQQTGGDLAPHRAHQPGVALSAPGEPTLQGARAQPDRAGCPFDRRVLFVQKGFDRVPHRAGEICRRRGGVQKRAVGVDAGHTAAAVTKRGSEQRAREHDSGEVACAHDRAVKRELHPVSMDTTLSRREPRGAERWTRNLKV